MLRDLTFTLARRVKRKLGLPVSLFTTITPFAIPPADVWRHRSETPGPVEELYYAHTGRQIHKFLHYLPIYDRVFRDLPYPQIRMLEIGVQKGGSLELWRKRFGPDAVIYGIDINPACGSNVTPPNKVMIGSQDDPAFLAGVVAEMGRPNIILDDGSHVGRHQIASFNALFPLLEDGGLYIIEDLQTAYWPGVHEGGFRRKGTAIEFLKTLVDDMNGWYHKAPSTRIGREEIGSIQFFDAVAVIEKRKRINPGFIMVGGPDPALPEKPDTPKTAAKGF